MTHRPRAVFVVPVAILLLAVIATIYLIVTTPRPPEHLIASGTIEAEEYNIAPIYPGRITTLKVDVGDTVKSGQVLVELDSEERNLAVGAAQAQASAAEAQAQSALAQVRQLERDVARLRALLAQGVVAPADVERVESQLLAARAVYNAAVDAAQAGTRNASVGKAGVEQYTLTSPIDGVVQMRNYRHGEVVMASSPILVVSRSDQKEMIVYIPQRQIARLSVGEKAVIKPDALPDEEFPATVEYISPHAEFTPRNIQTREERANLVFAVRLTVPDPQNRLRTGLTADVEFPEVPY